jgi:hypothetical protein
VILLNLSRPRGYTITCCLSNTSSCHQRIDVFNKGCNKPSAVMLLDLKILPPPVLPQILCYAAKWEGTIPAILDGKVPVRTPGVPVDVGNVSCGSVPGVVKDGIPGATVG